MSQAMGVCSVCRRHGYELPRGVSVVDCLAAFCEHPSHGGPAREDRGPEVPAAALVLVAGNTYPVRGALKDLGGVWDKSAKGWRVPADRAAEALALVTGAGRGSRRSGGARRVYGSRYTRFEGGAEVYTNRAGRCEDAPCCGCCS